MVNAKKWFKQVLFLLKITIKNIYLLSKDNYLYSQITYEINIWGCFECTSKQKKQIDMHSPERKMLLTRKHAAKWKFNAGTSNHPLYLSVDGVYGGSRFLLDDRQFSINRLIRSFRPYLPSVEFYNESVNDYVWLIFCGSNWYSIIVIVVLFYELPKTKGFEPPNNNKISIPFP